MDDLHVPLRVLCIECKVTRPDTGTGKNTGQAATPRTVVRISVEQSIAAQINKFRRLVDDRWPGTTVTATVFFGDDRGAPRPPPRWFGVGGGAFAKDYVHLLRTDRERLMATQLAAFDRTIQEKFSARAIPRWLADEVLDTMVCASRSWDKLVKTGRYLAAHDPFLHLGQLLYKCLFFVEKAEQTYYRRYCRMIAADPCKQLLFEAQWAAIAEASWLPYEPQAVPFDAGPALPVEPPQLTRTRSHVRGSNNFVSPSAVPSAAPSPAPHPYFSRTPRRNP